MLESGLVTHRKWDVIDLTVEPPLALQVRFEPSHLTGVSEVLKDPGVFGQAHIDEGAAVWPCNLDLAPDAICSAIKAHGEWVLR